MGDSDKQKTNTETPGESHEKGWVPDHAKKGDVQGDQTRGENEMNRKIRDSQGEGAGEAPIRKP